MVGVGQRRFLRLKNVHDEITSHISLTSRQAHTIQSELPERLMIYCPVQLAAAQSSPGSSLEFGTVESVDRFLSLCSATEHDAVTDYSANH
jgi:hypothetical protein